jgi:hypothetical protein
MHRAADDCSFQSANGSEASGGCRPTEQRATELVAKSPEPELSGMTEIACGSEEFCPPFLFPPRASRGGVGSPPRREHAARQQKALGTHRCRRLPPQEGLPPPCGSPASAVAQNLDRSEQTECFAEGSRPKNRPTLENRLHRKLDTTLIAKKQRKTATTS